MRQVETRLEKLLRSNNRNKSYEQGCSAELYTSSQVKWAMGTIANSTTWNRNSYFQQAFLADFGSQILRYWSTEHSRREIWPKLSRAYYILVLFVITTAFKHRWFHRRHTKFWHEVRRCVHSSSAPRAAAYRHTVHGVIFCNRPWPIDRESWGVTNAVLPAADEHRWMQDACMPPGRPWLMMIDCPCPPRPCTNGWERANDGWVHPVAACTDLIEWLRLMEPDHHYMHHHRIMHRQSIQTRLIIRTRKTKLWSDESASKKKRCASDQAPTLAKWLGLACIAPETGQDLRHLQGG